MVSQNAGLSVLRSGESQTNQDVGHTLWSTFLRHEEMRKGQKIFGPLLTSGAPGLEGREDTGCSLLVLKGSGSDDEQLPAGGQTYEERSISPVSNHSSIFSLILTCNTPSYLCQSKSNSKALKIGSSLQRWLFPLSSCGNDWLHCLVSCPLLYSVTFVFSSNILVYMRFNHTVRPKSS